MFSWREKYKSLLGIDLWHVGRAAVDTDLTITIALTGLGTAQVDNLAIRTLQRADVNTPSQTPQPATANQQRPAAGQTLVHKKNVVVQTPL